MKGAIFFSGKYGSTEQYAKWIGEAIGFPVFNIEDKNADPSQYDFIILGSSVQYFRLTMSKWLRVNFAKLKGKAKILFSVSGAGPGDELEKWIAGSIPSGKLSEIKHVGLRGRLDHSKVSWWVRQLLWIGSLFNTDPQARKEERYGFDYVDKDSIKPIIDLVEQSNTTVV